MKKFRGIFEQHREVGRFKPVKPHVVKPIGPRPEVDSAVAKVNEEQELDKKTPSVEDLAKKHNMSVSDMEDLISHGTKTEMEHTKEKKVAREIAMDHLKEKPDYYKKLKKYVESVQDTLHARHQELRKKSGLPHPDYYKELGKSYDIEDHEERAKKQAEIRAKYGQQRESVEELDEVRSSGAKMNKHFVYNRQNDPDDEDVSKLNVEPKDPYHKAKMERMRAAFADLKKTTFKNVKEETEVEKNSAAARTYKDKPEKEPMPKLKEDLRKWFDPKDPEGGWKRINSKGEAVGPCAREPGEAKPKCMSNEKRASLTKKERAAAVRAKRKHDPNPERKGEPINVSNYGKGKISEDIEQLDEKNVPTSPEKWARAKAMAKSKFDVYPSAYANGWAAKKYKEMGGGWKSVNEETSSLKSVAKNALQRQVNELKTFKESLQESRKAEIVKELVKKKKETKESDDKFQPDPELSSQIVKEHK